MNKSEIKGSYLRNKFNSILSSSRNNNNLKKNLTMNQSYNYDNIVFLFRKM